MTTANGQQAAPTTSAASPDPFDRASDRMNPILVKEVRQAVKSRAFIGTFLLLLLGSWLISMFGLLAAGPAIEYGSVGQTFFTFYFGVLLVAVFVVVPFGAFRSLLNERDDNTYELLSITTLSPGQIVRGKWACAVVQSLLFYSAIAPFIAFTALLQGFDFVLAGLLLVGALYGSAALSIATLMMSTTVRQRIWQGFLSLAVLAGLLGLIFSVLSGLSSLMMFPPSLDDPEFWWGIGIAFVMSASYLWLFYQIAASRLTFEAENRSTGIRLTAAAQFWLLWAAAATYHWFRGAPVDYEEVMVLTGLSATHWAVLGLSFAAEPDGLSRRVRRTLPRRAWLRPPLVPLAPGGSRGYLFVLLHLAALWVIAVLAWAWSASAPGGGIADRLADLRRLELDTVGEQTVGFATAVCLYIALYAGLATAFLRWGGRLTTAFQGPHARMVIVILVASGIMVPMGLRAGRWVQFNEVSVFDTVFPFWFLGEIIGRAAIASQYWAVAVATLVVVGLNVPAMYGQAREVLAGPHRSASRPHSAPGVAPPAVEPAGA